ncbi:MAG TPA: MFS transporter, partial [Anaerolineales bacterium]
TFVISVVTLWMMSPQPDRPGAQGESVTGAIAAGIRYMWNDPFLRTIFLIIAVANFVLSGPLNVGVPLLAKTRLAEGAAAYGIVISAYALGNLAGILGAGSFVRPSGRLIRTLTLVLFAGFALCLAAFGWVHSTWIVALMMLILGVGNGYNVISLFTLLQKRTPESMMGRLMGMVMIANIGLIPVSQSLAGLISRWSLTGLFEITGLLMLVLAVWLAVQKEFSAEKLASQLQSTPIFPPRGGVEP